MGLLLNPYVIMIALAILGKCGYDYRLRKQGEERALQKVEVEYKKTKKAQKKKAIKNKIKTTEKLRSAKSSRQRLDAIAE